MDLEQLFDAGCAVLATLMGVALLFDPNLSILGRVFGAIVFTICMAAPAVLALRDAAKPFSPMAHDGHETDIESVPD